jgi:dTMP kinase
MLISFEGIDCCGKTTQIKLLTDKLQQEQHSFIVLREPGGSEISERIRTILLDRKHLNMTQITELFLFSASRAQLVTEIIKPALHQNKLVICDRYVDSTTAYQGYGRGLTIGAVKTINSVATLGVLPKITFFIDISVHDMNERRYSVKEEKDRMELSNDEFYQRVRDGYLKLAHEEPDRFNVIDGKKSIEAIHDHIWSIIKDLLPANDA